MTFMFFSFQWARSSFLLSQFHVSYLLFSCFPKAFLLFLHISINSKSKNHTVSIFFLHLIINIWFDGESFAVLSHFYISSNIFAWLYTYNKNKFTVLSAVFHILAISSIGIVIFPEILKDVIVVRVTYNHRTTTASLFLTIKGILIYHDVQICHLNRTFFLIFFFWGWSGGVLICHYYELCCDYTSPKSLLLLLLILRQCGSLINWDNILFTTH